MKSIKLKSCLLALVSLALASCSDGAFKFNTPPSESESPAKPVIVSFKADPENIQSGEKTTLSYDVSGADEIIITGTSVDGSFNFSSDVLTEAAGTVQVDGIPSTTTFVLQAKKMAASAEEQPADDTKKQLAPGGTPGTPSDNPVTVPASDAISTAETTVTVDSVQQVSIELFSDSKEVTAEQPLALITWEATPADASVTITASNGEQIIPVTDCADLQTAQEAVAEETMPSLGCAVVTPTAPSTTYTAVATDAAGNSSQPSIVEIMVADNAPELSVELKVNGGSEETVSANNTTEHPTLLQWSVNDDDAQITITADATATCSPELPSGQKASELSEARSNGHKCSVSVPVTFTLTATRGDETKIATAKVVIESQPTSGIAKLNIVSSAGWAFVGESVSLNIAPADAASKAALKQVIVQGAESTTVDLSSGAQTVSAVAGKDGITVKSVSLDGTELPYHVVAGIDATVQSFSNAGGLTETAISSLALDPANPSTIYRGVQLSGFSDGKVRVYKGSSATDIDIKAPMNSRDAMTDGFYGTMGDYPVSAVAVREGKSEEVYVGTTGAFMRSTDGGAKYTLIDNLPRYKVGSYKKTYPSCKGKTQNGMDGGEIVSLGRVCDVIAEQDGRVIVATDIGVYTLPNIDSIENFSKPNTYIGTPEKGESGMLTYMAISHDLEKANGKYIAATSKGVFSSSDATTWEACGVTSGEIYALEYDSTRHELLAGGVDGNIYASSDDCKTWAQKGSVGGPVFDIAVDEQSASDNRSILVGTATGGYVTRDSGKTFSAIPGLAEASVEAVELAAISDGKGATDYVIAVGSSVGTISSAGRVNKASSSDVVPVVTPETPAEPTTPTTEPEDTPLSE